MFKVNSKDTGTMSLASFVVLVSLLLTLNIFTPSFSFRVSVVNFEVNAGWAFYAPL